MTFVNYQWVKSIGFPWNICRVCTQCAFLPFKRQTNCFFVLFVLPFWWRATFFTALVLLIYPISMFLIILLYSLIVRKLRKQTMPGIRSEETLEQRKQRNRSICKMSEAVVMAFFICCSPFAVYVLLTFYGRCCSPSSRISIHLNLFSSPE